MNNKYIKLVENSRLTMYEKVYSNELIIKLVEYAYRGYEENRVIKELKLPNSIFMESLTIQAKYNEVLIEEFLDSIKKLFSKISKDVKKTIVKHRERIIGWAQGTTLTSVAFMILITSGTFGNLGNKTPSNTNLNVGNETPIVKQINNIEQEIAKESKEDIAIKIQQDIYNEIYDKAELEDGLNRGEELNGDMKKGYQLKKELLKKVMAVANDMIFSKKEIQIKVMKSDANDSIKEEATKVFKTYEKIVDATVESISETINDFTYGAAKAQKYNDRLDSKINSFTTKFDSITKSNNTP
jgi:hypothetical protein